VQNSTVWKLATTVEAVYLRFATDYCKSVLLCEWSPFLRRKRVKMESAGDDFGYPCIGFLVGNRHAHEGYVLSRNDKRRVTE
jgi:hypothetical protein